VGTDLDSHLKRVGIPCNAYHSSLINFTKCTMSQCPGRKKRERTDVTMPLDPVLAKLFSSSSP